MGRNEKRAMAPADGTGGTPEILVVRYAKGTWDRTHPHERAGYERAVRPQNLLDLLSEEAPSAAAMSDAAVRQVVLGEDYERWLGDRAHSVSLAGEYAKERTVREHMADVAHAARLDISEWHYALAILIAGISGEHSALLPDPTVGAIRGYVKRLCANDDFSVYVSRTMVPFRAMTAHAGRFDAEADAYLDSGAIVRCADAETLSIPPDMPITLLCIPVTVRETHRSDVFTMREIRSYRDPGQVPLSREHVGRCLWNVDLTDPAIDVPAIQDTPAGRGIVRGALEIAYPGGVYGYMQLIPTRHLSELGNALEHTARREIKKRARRVRRKA